MTDYIERSQAITEAEVAYKAGINPARAIKAIPAVDVIPIGWTSCKIGLPKEFEDVLVWSSGVMFVASRTPTTGADVWEVGVYGGTGEELYINIEPDDYWQPRPLPPEEEPPIMMSFETGFPDLGFKEDLV